MVFEGLHVYLLYNRNEIIENPHVYTCSVGGLLDADCVLAEFPHTNILFPRGEISDYTGLHGDAHEIARFASQFKGGRDLSFLTKHIDLDLPWHRYIGKPPHWVQRRIERFYLKPALEKPNEYKTHLTLEKIPERIVMDRFPQIRWGILESYLRVLPHVHKFGEILSQYYMHKGVYIKPGVFKRRIKFAIGWGVGRMVTLNYLRGIPKYNGDPKEHNSLDKLVLSTVDAVPGADVLAGILTPEINDNLLTNKYDKTVIEYIWDFFKDKPEYRVRARFLFTPYLKKLKSQKSYQLFQHS